MNNPEQGEPQGQPAWTPTPPPQPSPEAVADPNPTATYSPAPPPPSPTQTTPPPNPANSKGLGILALILGIAAFLTGLIPWLGLVLALAAVAVSILAMVKKQPIGFTLTGIILGGIALITSLVVTIGFSAIIATGGGSTAVQDEPAAIEAPAPAEEPAEEPAAEEPVADPPTEEPAAAEPDGTATQPYAQPYVAKGAFLGGEKYSLTGRIVDANANALVEGWNQFNTDAPAGFKYVVVELSMTGIDPDGVEPSLANYDLQLATAEGNRYDSEFGVVFGDGLPSMNEGPTLYPGSAFTGYTAYIVPDSAQAFLLYDNGNYISF